MCVALSFLFGYLLRTRYVYPQIGRAFEASIDSKPYCVATCCSSPFLLHIFLKYNYSLRKNTLKILRAWERPLTSVPIGVYLRLFEVGTWLGKGSAKELWRFAEKWWPDFAPDSASSIRSVHRRWTDAAQEWPDAEQCFSSVRSEDGPTSGQTEKKLSGSIGLCSAFGQE